jgi:hypothetical protein
MRRIYNSFHKAKSNYTQSLASITQDKRGSSSEKKSICFARHKNATLHYTCSCTAAPARCPRAGRRRAPRRQSPSKVCHAVCELVGDGHHAAGHHARHHAVRELVELVMRLRHWCQAAQNREGGGDTGPWWQLRRRRRSMQIVVVESHRSLQWGPLARRGNREGGGDMAAVEVEEAVEAEARQWSRPKLEGDPWITTAITREEETRQRLRRPRQRHGKSKAARVSSKRKRGRGAGRSGAARAETR